MKLHTCLVNADVPSYDEISTSGFNDQLKAGMDQCNDQSSASNEAGSLVECAFNRQRDDECVLMCSMSTKSNQCFTYETESGKVYKKDGTLCGFHYPEPFACKQGKCLPINTDVELNPSIQAFKQPDIILPSMQHKEWYEATPFSGYDFGISAVGVSAGLILAAVSVRRLYQQPQEPTAMPIQIPSTTIELQ
jgi:hypothetical protein